MLAYEPPSVMEFRWGPDVVRLELHPIEDGTVLTLLDTLEERGKAARDGAGWHTCLDALERVLARRRRRPRGDEPAGKTSTCITSTASAPRRRRSARPRGSSDPRTAA